jgi:hypothetical protein
MRNNQGPAEGTEYAVYQSRLPLSTRTITMVAGLIRGHCKAIGSRWRKLPPGRIAVIVLAVLRHDQRLSDMAGGNGISASTVRRWLLEVIGLLAARAPRLDRALKKIARSGGEAVLIDGTLVRTRRRTGKANRRNYSGKHKAHGLLFLALTDTAGNLIWISAARPGRASEITTARHDKITAKLRETGLGAIADLGFTALDDAPDDNPVIITGRRAARGHPPHRRPEGSEPPGQPRTRGERARLRRSDLRPLRVRKPQQFVHPAPPSLTTDNVTAPPCTVRDRPQEPQRDPATTTSVITPREQPTHTSPAPGNPPPPADSAAAHSGSRGKRWGMICWKGSRDWWARARIMAPSNAQSRSVASPRACSVEETP